MPISVRRLLALSVLASVFMAFRSSRNPSHQASDPKSGYSLEPLSHPRVAGTEGGAQARKHIVDQLSKAGWEVDSHDFTASTPHGAVPMSNISAKRASSDDSKPRITSAAHYDSKALPNGFIGATDSAFPCASSLWLAAIRNKPVKRNFDLIFFDGEEAFVNWSDEDSIYGARALAEHQSEHNSLPSTLVSLDSLGNEQRFPIPSWFPETENSHRELADINPQLVGGRNLHQYAGMMQDDHVPFLKRNVPVSHSIPPNFPDVWHTLEDDANVSHWETMEAWADSFEKWLYK